MCDVWPDDNWIPSYTHEYDLHTTSVLMSYQVTVPTEYLLMHTTGDGWLHTKYVFMSLNGSSNWTPYYIHHKSMTTAHYVCADGYSDDSSYWTPYYKHHRSMAAPHHVRADVRSEYS